MADLYMRIVLDAQDRASGVVKSVSHALSGSGIRGIGGLLGAIGGVTLAAAGLGAALGVDAVRKSEDFQAAMLSNVAHAGLARDQLDKVSADVLKMSTDVGRSPTQLAEALYPILSAFSGIQNQSAKSALALHTLKLSFQAVAGTTVDGTAVANAAVGTFNALGLATNNAALNARRMTGLMDIMDLTVQQGNMQWDAYKNVISKLAVSIQGTSVKFTEASSALATLTNEGYIAQKAQTYLSNMFTTMIIKTDALAKHAAKLGISFDEQKYSAMNLADKIQYLNQVTDGNKQKILALLGGNATALKSFNALSTGIDSYKNKLNALNHAQGALAASLAVAQQGLSFQASRLKAAFDALLVTLGIHFLPYLSMLLGLITPIVASFTGWIDKSHVLQNGLNTLSGWLDNVGAAFHDVFDPLHATYIVMSDLADTFDRATKSLGLTTPAAKALFDTFDRAKGIIGSTSIQPMLDSFDRAKSILSKPLPNPWVNFFTGVKGIWDFISKIDWGGIGNTLSKVGTALGNIATTISKIDWGGIGKSAKDLWGVLQKNLGPQVTQLGHDIQTQLWPALQNLGTSLKPLLPGLKDLGTFAGGLLIKEIGSMITALDGLVLVLTALANVLAWLETEMQNFTKAMHGFGIPSLRDLGIPGFASGIENFGGGMAYVHGGEVLTYLPPGSSVTPASKVGRGAPGSGMTLNLGPIYVNDFGPNMPNSVANAIVDKVDAKLGMRYKFQYNGTQSGVS